MIALLQRVSHAEVHIDNHSISKISQGLLVLLGIEQQDGQSQADRLLERILNYRIFSDANGRMNLSLKQIDGGLLLVPQFTLAAATDKGLRPSFTPAANPETAAHWFKYLQQQAAEKHPAVASGVFGADMQVSLINDGPVTFWLQQS